MTTATILKAIGIRGAIAIALAVVLGIVMWRADGISADRDDWQRKAIQTELQLTISNQSIDTLETSLARFVGAGKAARVVQLAAIEAQAKDSAKLQRQANAIRAEMATIASGGRCDTPESIRGADL